MNSRRVFLGVSTIVFAASAAMTIATCASTSAMGEMPMPGGWTMSHMWMRMPGQSWSGAAASFVGTWVVMMVAMMLPSLVPALLSYRESVGRTGAARPDCLTALAGVGYFAVWAAFGLSIFPLGAAVADVAMREPELSRTVPIVIGVAVLMAGVVQQTEWKARHLAFCREAADGHLTPYVGVGAAWRHGLHLGLRCTRSCIGLTVVVLALGMMDLRVMAVVGAAITAERLAANGRRVSRAIGAVGVTAGLLAIARAAGLGLG